MSPGRASPTLPSLNNAAQHDLSADNGRAAFVLSTPFLPRTIPLTPNNEFSTHQALLETYLRSTFSLNPRIEKTSLD